MSQLSLGYNLFLDGLVMDQIQISLHLMLSLLRLCQRLLASVNHFVLKIFLLFLLIVLGRRVFLVMEVVVILADRGSLLKSRKVSLLLKQKGVCLYKHLIVFVSLLVHQSQRVLVIVF